MKPSPEQLAQIRKFSQVIFGDAEAAFREHGRPETRDEASDLLVVLSTTPIRKGEMKTCRVCDETKPLNEFYKGQGACKPCYNARLKARKQGKKPVPPAKREASAGFDPSLSTLRAVQVLLSDKFGEATLDDVADLLAEMADLLP